ncbi:MAG: peptidoglycan-associated lipoprotein Pal [Pseudomonadota bacterium]|nr:peptidoglycan-associated lipoprotein Pal [Pseudomonadota bacterium]
MKKVVLSVTLAALLAACSSTPTKTEAPAKVDEVKVAPKPPAKAETPPPPAAPQAIAPAKPLPEAKVDDSAFPPKGQGGALGQRSIYYAFDVFAVTDEYKPVAEAHAGFLAKHAKAKVTLQGNCDERGSREYNLALGQRRADGVKSLMTLSGASGDQIEVVSFGKEKPAAQGHDEESWAKNRRTDIVYSGE